LQLPVSFLSDSPIDSRWFAGPFYNLKMLSAKTKGKRFEQIAQFVFESRCLVVDSPDSSDHDRIVSGEKLEVKGSTITRGTDDCFSFLQIRPDQDYDFLVLETFWFDGTIQFHKISKETVIKMIGLGIFKKQHGGNKAESRTFCYNGNMLPFSDHYWFDVKIDNS
jgi:hypothetical protein